MTAETEWQRRTRREAARAARVAERGNFCELCGNEPKSRGLSEDHDHKTGAHRGWLCFRCNRALPAYVTLEWLRKAVAYLERAGSASAAADEPGETPLVDDEPAAATLAEPEREGGAGRPSGRQVEAGTEVASGGHVAPGSASAAADEPLKARTAGESPGKRNLRAAADEPCDEACREEGKCSGYCAEHGDPVAAADEPGETPA